MNQTPRVIAQATVAHTWTHARLGPITEHVCSEHDALILGALRVLGAGSSGIDCTADDVACGRCAAEATRTTTAAYLRGLTG